MKSISVQLDVSMIKSLLCPQASDQPVKDVMDTWTLQMGYPMLEVKRSSTNTVIATQQRFLLNPEANDTEEFTSPFG